MPLVPPRDGNLPYSREPVDKFVKGLQSTYGQYNDPTYLGFVLLFDFNDAEHSPLLVKNPDTPNTAANYLQLIGDTKRLEYLTAMIEAIESINYLMPWYWQELEGLNTAWNYNKLEDPYRGGDDAVISIGCLESIDLRVTMIMDLYRKACFDIKNRREIVPENLRKFGLWIYVQEIRKFKVDNILQRGFNSALNREGQGVTEAVVNENSAYLFFQFHECEFLPDASSEFLAALSQNPEMTSQRISFTYEDVEENSNEYPLVEIAVDEERNLKEKILSTAKEAGINALETGVRNVAQQINGKIQNLLLGNVHGFSVGTALTALEQGSIQGLGLPGSGAGGGSTINLGDVFEPAPPRPGIGDLGNVNNLP